MKVKRMGITEIFGRIWLFSANKIKSSEFVSKKPTQVIVEINSSLRQKLSTIASINVGVFYMQCAQTNVKFQTSLKEAKNRPNNTCFQRNKDIIWQYE
jgi:hypothetical protein